MSAPPERARRMPVVLAVLLGLALGLVGFATGWVLGPETSPEAETVARDLGALLESSHPILEQDDDAKEVAALYAEDALATDAPSGDSAQGREAIAGGWQYMFAQAGRFSIDHVLADDRWATLVMTWTVADAQGEGYSTPMILLLEIEDGLIVSELDIYDAGSAQ